MSDLKPHILIVDDEEQILKAVESCLLKFNFSISLANNANEAFKILETNRCDVILSDIKMPGEDGIHFLERFHEKFPKIPFVLMTGFADLQMTIDAIKFGAFDFIQKPIHADHLRKVIEKAVEYKRLIYLEENYKRELEKTVIARTEELKNAMRELEALRSELLKRTIDNTDFIRNMSHELRTPMNGVVGGVSLLEDQVQTKEGKQYLNIINQSADKMLVVIDQMLAFLNQTSPKSLGEKSNLLNLHSTLNELITKNGPSYDLKNISLSLEVSPLVPHELLLHKEYLNRLLNILLENALKFTENGSVKLIVAFEAEQIIFSVKDTGVGIPTNMLELIFEPFVQADTSTTRRFGGVGLGLTIARQYAMALHGKLWAEQNKDGGSTFKFSMNA